MSPTDGFWRFGRERRAGNSQRGRSHCALDVPLERLSTAAATADSVSYQFLSGFWHAYHVSAVFEPGRKERVGWVAADLRLDVRESGRITGAFGGTHGVEGYVFVDQLVLSGRPIKNPFDLTTAHYASINPTTFSGLWVGQTLERVPFCGSSVISRSRLSLSAVREVVRA